MPCGPLTVANSETVVTGNTGDAVTVRCADGYESSDGFAFTVTCVAEDVGSSVPAPPYYGHKLGVPVRNDSSRDILH